MIHVLIVSTLLLCAPVITFAQAVQVSGWRTLSSLTSVRAADRDRDGAIWAATSGGVIRIEQQSRTTTEYRNVNALQTLDCTALRCDRATGSVFVGQRDGALDVWSPSGTWTALAEIRRATQYPRRAITDIELKGDTLFIATEFGIVLYRRSNGTFIETVDRIGSLQEKTRVSGLCVLNDTIWAATDSGVVAAPLAVGTLRLPSVWKIYGTESGLDARKVSHIATNGSSVVVATDYTCFEWNDGRFVSRIGTTQVINGLSVDATDQPSRIMISTPAELRDLSGPRSMQVPSSIAGHTRTSSDASADLLIFVRDRALGRLDGNTLELLDVNSPISNQFAHMTVDRRGGLWVATDVDPPRTGQGVSYFTGTRWQNINTATTTALRSNACYRVSRVADGSIWIGTWGGGALKCTIGDDSVQMERIDHTNSSLAGISVDPAYVLVAEVAQDRRGRTWLLNEQAADRLFAIGQGDTWLSAANCTDARSTIFRTMAIDNNGAVWAGSPTGNGVIVYNDRGTESTTDDICQAIRSSNTQLQDNAISVIRADRSGAIWIGTAKGVSVVSSPGSVTATSLPFIRRISALSSAVVNDIVVDALNYKWVATTGGVFVLNDDGTEVLATITKASSPLLDDNVRTIAIDDQTGTVYFGTTNGCSVAQSSSIRPSAEFMIKTFPQPFRAGTDAQVTIDGLTADADLRIMTPSGILVAAFQARGKQALWDGRDVRGELVPPGVYIISASSPTTNTSAVGKIAVTR